METEKNRKIIYNLLLEESLDAFYSAIRNQLHVYKVVDLTHVTRRDLCRIGLLSGPDIKRFERVVGRVTKSGGIKSKFTKVLGKKNKQKDIEIPPAVSLWEDFEPVIIKSEDLKQKDILGEGNFGEVFKGEWTRRIGGHESIIPVAIKCLKDQSNQGFMKEVSILAQLDQKHENIIKLYGLSIHEDCVKMVTEFAEEGSLLAGLRSGEIVSISLLCQFAVQIASGMMYLEQKGLVHRDLAARNILVTAHNQVKVSDFGLAKLIGKENEWVMTKEEALPIRWLPPECLLEGKFTSASDVWSFGVVLWEMFTFGEHPWNGLPSTKVIEGIKNGERLFEPDYCPAKIYTLVMQRCWMYNPEERLDFEAAKSCLVSIHPTSSYATGSQHYLDELSYNEGDIITAIKPYEGAADVWIGQNEMTGDFGRFIKSQTNPMQCKIPFAATATISPGSDSPTLLQNGRHESPPIPIPSTSSSSHADTKQEKGRRESMPCHYPSVESKVERNDENGVTDSELHNRVHSTGELGDHSGEEDEEVTRPSSLPLPDLLAAGTIMRYPSVYVNMKLGSKFDDNYDNDDKKNESMRNNPKTGEIPAEQTERPRVPPRTDKNNVRRKSGEEPSESQTIKSESNRPVPAKRVVKKKDAPRKPMRVSKNVSFEKAEELEASSQTKNNDSNNLEIKRCQSNEFQIDPEAWMGDISSTQSGIDRQLSRSDKDLAQLSKIHQEANASFTESSNEKLGEPSKSSRLRKTQSLESLSMYHAQQEIAEPLLRADRPRSKSSYATANHNGMHESRDPDLEEPSSLESSADSVTYAKLKNEEVNEEEKKKSLFRSRKKKKSKESKSYKVNAEVLSDSVKQVLDVLPNATEPDVFAALEISRWNVEDAIKFLKVKELVKLGLCPQPTCLQMLRTYDWSVDEASFAIKLHHILAIRLELSLEEAAKLLRQNNWNVDVALNVLQIRDFFRECEEIGFSKVEAQHSLSFLGNVEDAVHALKARRVADVTQKPEDYCRRTLEHCQWKVERAIDYIISIS